MERIDSVNADRILWCCNDAGISITELSMETGVSVEKLNNVINESAGLTFNQLSKIAEFFGRGVLFFLEKAPIQEQKIHSLDFRTLSNQKPNLSQKLRKLIERVEQHRDMYLSLMEDLGWEESAQFHHPEFKSNLKKPTPEQVREWLELDEKNDFDSYRNAIESKGILVFQSNGYNGKWQIPKESPILGFSLYHKLCPVIVVRKRNLVTQQVFTLMHELAHLLLHKTSSIDDEEDLHSHQGREYEANNFAGRVLVSDHFLEQIDLSMKPDTASEYSAWLDLYKKKWGVSTEVILRRLSDESMISVDDYENYRTWLKNQKAIEKSGGSRGYRHREPKHIFGNRYVRTIFDAKNSKKLTLAKASSYLDNLKIKDLHQLERHIAGS